ncbi:MAG: hypothetical protein JXR86_04660 [Spirochaetales bacterium]|nr:hypothetical protein [Spirochaetales bacterium]
MPAETDKFEDPGAPVEMNEVFISENKPVFIHYATDDFFLLKPWNYEKDYNSGRKYPLLAYLHGYGSDGLPPDYLQSEDFLMAHPSFIYVPHTAGSWDNSKLIEQFEDLKGTWRIDNNRVYLIGYSMGGSGSYSLANSYYDQNRHLFAGIIRLAGMSQKDVRDAIAEKTSIWVHFGLQDDDSIISATGGAFDFLRDHFESLPLVENPVPLSDHQGTTYSIYRGELDIVKKTEYDNEDHGIYRFPFDDPYLLQWLYSQSLLRR